MLLTEMGRGTSKFTAMNFLSFMMTLNRAFIQDAAAMFVLLLDEHRLYIITTWHS
jgi:hypothetical protein